MSKKLDGDTTDVTSEDADDKDVVSAEDKAAGDSTQTDKTDDKSSDTDWEKRFKGLQPKHQTLVEDNKNLKVQFALDKKAWDEEKVTLGLEIDELKGGLKTATESGEGLTKSNDELAKTVGSLETQIERNTLIMSEYPDLAVLEAKSLIRKDLEGDELTEALDSMRSLMKTTGETAAAKLAAGATGSDEQITGSRGQGHDVNSISDLLMVAQKNKDQGEITRLTNLLIKQAETEIFAQE